MITTQGAPDDDQGDHVMNDGLAQFIAYQDYLETIKDRLPSSAFEFATAQWHFDPEDPRCPYDSWLEDVKVHVRSSGIRSEMRESDIYIRLLGPQHNGYIGLLYKSVLDYTIVKAKEWHHDEVRLTDEGYIEHKIKFDGGKEWLILCEDIAFQWNPFIWLETVEHQFQQVLREWKRFEDTKFGVSSVAFISDKHSIYKLEHGIVTIIDSDTGKALGKFGNNSLNMVSAFALSPNGLILAYMTTQEEYPNDYDIVHLVDIPTSQQVATLRIGGNGNNWSNNKSLNFSPNGLLLATATEENTHIWDVQGRVLLYTLSGYWNLDFSNDLTTIACVNGKSNGSSNIGVIRFCNAISGEEKTQLIDATTVFSKVAFSPDGKKLAAIGRDSVGPSVGNHTVVIWDVATGLKISDYNIGYDITTIAWHREGHLLAIAGRGNDSKGSGWISVCDIYTGQVLQTIAAHEKSVNSAIFSADGRYFVSGGSDGVVKLWQVEIEH